VETSFANDIEETKKFWLSYPIDNFYHSPLLSLVDTSGIYEEAMNNVKGMKKGICVDPFITFGISHNGDVCLCPQDFNDIWITGNIFKDSPDEVWNGERAQMHRRALIDDDKEFFANCMPCDKCNAPYLEEYNTDGHRKHMPSRMERKVRTFHI